MLEIHLMRLMKARKVDQFVLATTVNPSDKPIADLGEAIGVLVFRGDEHDVLSRYYLAVEPVQPEFVVRVTSDCPLIDPAIVDQVVTRLETEHVDYVSNTLAPSFPDGMDVEAFRFDALKIAYKEATLPSDREHVTPFIWRNSDYKGGARFKVVNVASERDFSQCRLTVDEPADLEVISTLIKNLGSDRPWQDYVDYLFQHPELAKVNSHYQRNEGYMKSLKEDEIAKD